MSLSIIVASSGRPTLGRALDSILLQVDDTDELLLSIQHTAPWGHAARNQLMLAARGDFMLFMDDDDAYVPGAFDVVRAAIREAPERIHMFRMRYANGYELWVDKQVRCGNVSTVMFAVPNDGLAPPGQWGDRYEGDFDFISMARDLRGEPIWHEDVIALVRP